MSKRAREGNSDINEPAAKVIKIDDSTSLQSFLGDLLFGKIGKGWHPLDFATWVKNQTAQDYFINKGYSTREERSSLSIHNAVIYGDTERMKDFLRVDPSCIESVSYYEHKPLTAAIAMSNKEMVDFLLDNRADIEGVAGEKKYTPLATAISINDIDMVALLLDRRADIDRIVSPGSECTPLLMALGFRDKGWVFDEEVLAATPNIEIAKLLIERDADVDALHGWHSAVAQASCINLPEIIEILFQKGASFLQVEEHNIVELAWEFKAHDSMEWFMGRLQKPADQYDEDTMYLAFQVIEGCMKNIGKDKQLSISFLYEVLSHDTDDKLILREFEKQYGRPLLEYALISYNPNDDSCLKDREANIVTAVLATNGTNDVLLPKPPMEDITALLDLLQTYVFFVPSYSIIINDLPDVSLHISIYDWHTPKRQLDRTNLNRQIDKIEKFLKVIDFESLLYFPRIIPGREYDSKPKCYEQIVDAANKKIHKTLEDNIKNGQWLKAYFSDMKFTDASGNNMGDPGLIICEYLGASAQRIMVANKSNPLSLSPSLTDSGSEGSAAASSSSYEVSCAGESENASMDG